MGVVINEPPVVIEDLLRVVRGERIDLDAMR